MPLVSHLNWKGFPTNGQTPMRNRKKMQQNYLSYHLFTLNQYNFNRRFRVVKTGYTNVKFYNK